MASRIRLDPSGDDVDLPNVPAPVPIWPWVVAGALGLLLLLVALAYWEISTRPVVNAYPVWCPSYAFGAPGASRSDGYEPAIPCTSSSFAPKRALSLAELFVSPARAQQVPPPGLNTTLDEPMKARAVQHARWRITQADGSRIAYEMLDDDPISELIMPTDEARRYASAKFEEMSQKQGAAGFYRLALAYLGNMAFDIAIADKDDRALKAHDRMVVPFCPDSEFVQTQDPPKAFRYLVWADDCDTVHPPLFGRWMDAIARGSRWSEREVARLKTVARADKARAIKGAPWNGNEDFFCTGTLTGTLIGENEGPPPSVQTPRTRGRR